MDIHEALEVADSITSRETVKAIKRLAMEVRNLRDWVVTEGERNDVCTRNILGKVCSYCKCGKKP